MSDSNGLLLLWNAAVELEGSDIEKMIIQARHRRNHSLKLMKSRDKSYLHNGKRSQVPIRHSHNELEKSRRAHLRSCMEKLKKVLRFDQESVPCRITMLNVLKRASTTIYDRERSIHLMSVKETMAKNRFVELTNRLNNLQRQLKRLKNMHVNTIESDKAERMRNYSECSILTTSSDDSAFDSARSRQISMNYSSVYGDDISPVNIEKDEELSKFFKLSTIRDDPLKGINRTAFKCSSPNSNSCDSGFEESNAIKGLMISNQTIFVNNTNNNNTNSNNNNRKMDSNNSKLIVFNDIRSIGKERSFVMS